jgi:hypothetical protein
MARSSLTILESEINKFLADALRSQKMLVLQNVRIHPCELDIVALDTQTLRLVNIEIKRADWRTLLNQALRGTLYCHYSVAALPESMRAVVPEEEFRGRGIGLLYFEPEKHGISWTVGVQPLMSTKVNRSLKKLLYSRFYARYGDGAYA